MIEIKNLEFEYHKGYPVIKNISFSVNNESLGIIGANGAGKSTLLKLISGIELDYKGMISINDTLVSKKTLNTIRQHLGFVFQDSDTQLFMPKVYEDIAFGLYNQGLDEETINNKVEEIMHKLSLSHLKDRQIYRLSGGEKKLVSLASVLVMEPEILLFDEPTIALDPRNRKTLINMINSLDHTKIITSHDLDLIYDTCERTIILDHGEMIIDGHTKEILTNKELLESHGLELPLSFQRINRRD